MADGVPSSANEMTRRGALSAIACAMTAAGGAEFFGQWLRAAESHSPAPPEPDGFTNYKQKTAVM